MHMVYQEGNNNDYVSFRSIAVNPTILLADEPASALDPRSSFQIEELLMRLKEDYTVVIVT